MEELDRLWTPAYKDWRLNERHYGALQGLNKLETSEKYGASKFIFGDGVMMSDLRK